MVITKKVNQGFTLLEILIALVVFVLGSISIWGLFASAINTYNQSVDHEIAAIIASSIVAELQDVRGKSLPPIYKTEEGKSPHFPNYKYKIKRINLGHGATFLKIKIIYLRRGREREFKFNTVIYHVLP